MVVELLRNTHVLTTHTFPIYGSFVNASDYGLSPSLCPTCMLSLSFEFSKLCVFFLPCFYFNWASAVSLCCQFCNIYSPLSDAALYRCFQPYHLYLIRQWTITNSSSHVSSLAGIISGIIRHITEEKITPWLYLSYLIIYFKKWLLEWM